MLTGREEKVSVVVDKVAKRHGAPITSVALAYVMQKVRNQIQLKYFALTLTGTIHLPHGRR